MEEKKAMVQRIQEFQGLKDFKLVDKSLIFPDRITHSEN